MRCVVFLAHACYNLSENCHANLQNIDGGGKGTGGDGRRREGKGGRGSLGKISIPCT